VAQLAGYVSEHSAYHHGEVCCVFPAFIAVLIFHRKRRR
jgi:hypothetical protein